MYMYILRVIGLSQSLLIGFLIKSNKVVLNNSDRTKHIFLIKRLISVLWVLLRKRFTILNKECFIDLMFWCLKFEGI